MLINRRERVIGAVESSILTEAQYQAIYGTEWVLMDGRSITGSLLATYTGISTLPDARGATIRCKNNGRSDGNQDPGGERALGSFQSHATAMPTTPFVTGNESNTHTHSMSPVQLFSGGGAGNGGGNAGGAILSTGTQSSNHTHSVASGGDNETRMKNVALNFFIKIN